MDVAEKDSIARKIILSIEPAPLIFDNVNRGKGLVFEYDFAMSSTRETEKAEQKSTFLADAIKEGKAMRWKPEASHTVWLSRKVQALPMWVNLSPLVQRFKSLASTRLAFGSKGKGQPRVDANQSREISP